MADVPIFRAATRNIQCARVFLAPALLVILLTVGGTAIAQNEPSGVRITGDRLSGFVLPIEPTRTDIRLRALRAWAWTIDDTKRLVLEGDVGISIGTFSFFAKEAAVWINRIPSADGVINQIAVFFPKVDDPTKQAGLGAQGEHLLVTGSTRGEVKLNVALMEEGASTRRGLLRQAEARLALHLRTLVANPPGLGVRPRLDPAPQPPPFIPIPGGAPPDPSSDLPTAFEMPPPQGAGQWLLGPQGTVRFSARQVDVSRGEDENVITAMGDIVVELLSDRNDDSINRLTLAAERAVIFTDPGPLIAGENQISGERVRGVYLEGSVSASSHDGEYAIRAPQIYYDFRTQKAIMVDSLLRVQPRDIRVPVYARAREMRQLAENQWETNRVNVSTSEFATPHLAIGARRATITRREPQEGETGQVTHVDSRDNTLRLAGVPIFYWPRFAGDIERVPLKSIEAGSRKEDGFRVLTTWDFFSLTGMTPPEGVEADFKFDVFTKRGAGMGFDLIYDVGDSEGRVDLYGLYDTGTDRTSSGRRVTPDDENRGVILLENQSQLSRYWSLQAQASFISDETFITSWREDDFHLRREYETSLYLKHQRENAAFTLLVKDSLQDFISNSYLLASKGYSVDKAPEATYRRYGDSVFGDRITYSSETRLSRMALAFVERTPNQLGVPGRAFGLPNTVMLSSAAMAAGLREDWVMRGDTRHELSMPLQYGVFNVTPFVVGRFTGYDSDFATFSSNSDEMRIYGAGGVRVSSIFQRVINGVENQLLDLHRMRHLFEPYLTLWTSYASVTQMNLPVYDDEVESLADGSAMQLGMRNTWQTQRGGPGRWRSVDWLTLDTSIVIDSEGAPNESPTPQFFEYRPEYSMFGDHARARGVLLLSDNVSIAADATYLLDTSMFVRSSVGLELRHSPVLFTYIEYRNIQANRAELLDIGWQYKLTPKYTIAFTPQWDFRADDFRTVALRVTRTFPDFDFVVVVRYDNIRGDTLFGASLDLARF